MQQPSFFKKAGQQFLNPILQQGFQGNLVPGTPENVRKTGTLFSNIVQNNLGIKKEDETGSFQFHPYQGGFSLDTPSGWGISAYANKMSTPPGPRFRAEPMGKTIEARFRFGAQPDPISNRINIEVLPNDDENKQQQQQLSAGRKFDDEDKQQQLSAGRRFLEEYITPGKAGEAARYYYR